MRGSKTFVSSLVLGAALWTAAAAAPANAPSPSVTTPAASAGEADCQKVGGDVSALIDKGTRSPNVAAARAVFQVGIMECMDGDDAAANKHYDDAKKLLTNELQTAPVTAPKPKQAG